MASINLDRKSRLKFGLSRDMQVSLYDPKLLKISMVMVTCWCWQCGIVLEPSVVAVCDFNHRRTRQSQDPIGTHIPVPTRTHRPPNSETLLKLFWKSDVSPKREAPQYKFNQGHHSKGFPMLNSAFWTRVWWHVDCGNQDARMIQKLTRLIFRNLNQNLGTNLVWNLFTILFSFLEFLTNILLSIVYTRAAAALMLLLGGR